ncbi:50S ribosomal protein L11 methyltransferase [Pseudothermotoga sp. U03pept]|uniref:50S ribosomal protein L11 methyltransferase n=1 Tax=Pseudothermotoga sp. U03pept TaxID=3447012 RepID=UPI003F05F040
MFKEIIEWHLLPSSAESLENELLSRDFFNYALEATDNGTKLILYTDDEAFVKEILELTQSQLLEKKSSRVEQWFKYMKLEPFEITNGVWIDPTGKLKKPGATVVKMRPSAAFGSGDHATTALAAKLLVHHIKRSYSVLDVGCGTAVLSIIAKKMGAKKVLAIDNDPVAIDVAREFVRKNRVKVDVILSDLLADVHGKYDLVVANILTPVIIKLIDQIEKVTHTGSTLVVSGIPTKDDETIKAKFTEKGFIILSEGEMQNWKAYAVRIC